MPDDDHRLETKTAPPASTAPAREKPDPPDSGKPDARPQAGSSAKPPKPPSQRPELPDFWDLRFAAGTVPWNAGGIPAELPAFVRELHRPRSLSEPRTIRETGSDSGTDAIAHLLQNLRILIPGCGHAYEAAYFAALGGQVTALDFSAAAVAAARELLGAWPGELLHADFFAYTPPAPFDLIYERAFLCALPRKCWHDYAEKTAALLAPGGCLAGFFLYGEEGKGPPFAAAPQTVRNLLDPFFTCVEDRASLQPLPLFAGERWQVWRRKAP